MNKAVFNEEQIEAIRWGKGPLLVLGTPGSGKTTVITYRILNLIEEKKVRPENILVITFTKAAAESMKERFLNISGRKYENVRFSTFHSFFYWIIRTAYKFSDEAVITEEEKMGIIRKLLKQINPEYADNNEVLNSVLLQMDIINFDMIDISDYYSKDMPSNDFKRLFLEYQDEKKKLRRLDFNDMSSMCYTLLKERKDILKQIQRLYPYIMVDEFQDTNLIQYEILKLLVHPGDNIFAVGDDDQSIYGFRGARPDIMLSFGQEFNKARILTLSLNYRCPKVICDKSRNLITNNKKRYKKRLRSGAGDKGRVTLIRPKDNGTQCEMIVDRIRLSIKEGILPSEIAVLYRTNQDPRKLIFKLREFNIPFVLKDLLPDIFNHFAVVPIISYMLFAIGDDRRKIFLNFMNKPVRYISRNMLKYENVDLRDLILEAEDKDYLVTNIRILNNQLRRISRLDPYAAINYIRKAVGYDDYIAEFCDKRNMDKEEIFDILNDFQGMAEGTKDFNEFFTYMEDYRKILIEESKKKKMYQESLDGVRLMTMHSAKGLEFKEVHIINCVEGDIPHKKANTDSEIEEERRMFYVALTRSSELLYIYSPKTMGSKSCNESRFLKELESE